MSRVDARRPPPPSAPPPSPPGRCRRHRSPRSDASWPSTLRRAGHAGGTAARGPSRSRSRDDQAPAWDGGDSLRGHGADDTSCPAPRTSGCTAEHADLTTRGRIEIAQAIERARELGDLSENGDYHAAKDQQGHMEGRIRTLEAILDNAEIVDDAVEGVVSAGSVVTIRYERRRRAGRDLSRRPHRGGDRARRDLALVPAGIGPDRQASRRRGRVRRPWRRAQGASCSRPRPAERRVQDLSVTEQSAAPPLPPDATWTCPGRGTTFIREVAGTARGARARPAPRVDRHGRHQLVPILRGPRSSLPCDRPRPPRTRARTVVAGTVPPSRLRRRRGGAGGRAGHRPV